MCFIYKSKPVCLFKYQIMYTLIFWTYYSNSWGCFNAGGKFTGLDSSSRSTKSSISLPLYFLLHIFTTTFFLRNNFKASLDATALAFSLLFPQPVPKYTDLHLNSQTILSWELLFWGRSASSFSGTKNTSSVAFRASIAAFKSSPWFTLGLKPPTATNFHATVLYSLLKKGCFCFTSSLVNLQQENLTELSLDCEVLLEGSCAVLVWELLLEASWDTLAIAVFLETREPLVWELFLEANSDAATCEALLEVSIVFTEVLLLGVSEDVPDEELFLETDDETLASELALEVNPLEAVSELGLEDNSGNSTSELPEEPNKGTSISETLWEAEVDEPSKALFFGDPLCCLESVDWVTWLFTLDFNNEETNDAEPCLSGTSGSEAFPDPTAVTWEAVLLLLWLATARSPSLVALLFWLGLLELRAEFPLLCDLEEEPEQVELLSCWPDVLAGIFRRSCSTAELFFPSMARFLAGSSTPSEKKESRYISLLHTHTSAQNVQDRYTY